MKEFNLEEAKAGKVVCTRNGKPARIICFDRKHNDYPIVALIAENNNNSEEYMSYTIDGKFYNTGNRDGYDLMMVSEKKEGWINIYPNNSTSIDIYKTKEEAVKDAGADCIATIKIEWEDNYGKS